MLCNRTLQSLCTSPCTIYHEPGRRSEQKGRAGCCAMHITVYLLSSINQRGADCVRVVGGARTALCYVCHRVLSSNLTISEALSEVREKIKRRGGAVLHIGTSPCTINQLGVAGGYSRDSGTFSGGCGSQVCHMLGRCVRVCNDPLHSLNKRTTKLLKA